MWLRIVWYKDSNCYGHTFWFCTLFLLTFHSTFHCTLSSRPFLALLVESINVCRSTVTSVQIKTFPYQICFYWSYSIFLFSETFFQLQSIIIRNNLKYITVCNESLQYKSFIFSIWITEINSPFNDIKMNQHASVEVNPYFIKPWSSERRPVRPGLPPVHRNAFYWGLMW